MRPIWTGAISFGLINIPVRLYTAVKEGRPDFTYLHNKDLSPIRYARVCKADGKEIPFTDVVKGYEYDKGDYVVLQDDDFKRADIRKTQTIDITDFVNKDEIDIKLLEKPYYLSPTRESKKAYALLSDSAISFHPCPTVVTDHDVCGCSFTAIGYFVARNKVLAYVVFFIIMNNMREIQKEE